MPRNPAVGTQVTKEMETDNGSNLLALATDPDAPINTARGTELCVATSDAGSRKNRNLNIKIF